MKYRLSANPLLSNQTVELWQPVMNKKVNPPVPYKTIQQCNDLERLAKDEPELVKEFGTALTDWLNADKNNIEVLKDLYNGGFKKTIGEYEYKMVQFNNGSRQISRYKRGQAGSRGGRSYTLLRPVTVKIGKIEEVQNLLTNQAKNDNWDIKYMYTADDGDRFLMTNQAVYVPTSDTANGDSSAKEEEDGKEESN